jgi:hypothetical protein
MNRELIRRKRHGSEASGAIAVLGLAFCATSVSAGGVRFFLIASGGDPEPIAWDGGSHLRLPAATAYLVEVEPFSEREDEHEPWDALVMEFHADGNPMASLSVGRDSLVAFTVGGSDVPVQVTLERTWSADRLDLDGDGLIDADDLAFILARIRTCPASWRQDRDEGPGPADLPCGCRRLDLDFNGLIDAADVAIFLDGWSGTLERRG